MSKSGDAVHDAFIEHVEYAETVDPVERFVALTREKRDLADKLKAVNEQLRDAEQAVLSTWLESGTQNMKRNGVTLYVSRDMSVRVTDKDAARAACDKLGLRDILAPNNAQLKAWLKEYLHVDALGEWVVDPAKMPAELRDAIEVDEYHRLGCRGA